MLRPLALILLLSVPYVQAQERPLRFSITESGTMPLVDIQDGVAVGGILHDLYQRLAQKVGRQAQIEVLPRLRVQQAMLHGEIDMRCYVNPVWVNDPYHQYLWSIPFMQQRDVLVARDAAQQATTPPAGSTIGTVLGFAYPTLEQRLLSGELRRDDARTQGLVLDKLAAQRYDYAVSNDLALRWYNTQHSGEAPLHEVQELTDDPVSCLVRNEPDVPTMQLLRAMVRMKQDGEFDAILQRYR